MPRVPKEARTSPRLKSKLLTLLHSSLKSRLQSEAAAAEIASITANIDALKADLKAKKAELKSID